MPELTSTLSLTTAAFAHPAAPSSEADFTQWVNAAFKNYHSALALARSPLANSMLIGPLLVLDDVSPTADERGHAMRLVLQWAVNRLAPTPAPYPLGQLRPLDDPTWRDPHWWRYNILRHRYVEPLHPDEFVEGGRATETLIALTGIPTTDTFFDERNRAIREVAQRLYRQQRAGDANDELQQLALEEVSRPLQIHKAAHALLGVAATFEDVFPRTLLLQMTTDEHLDQIETALDYLTAQRFLLMGDGARYLWLSPVLQKYVYARQSSANLRRRHQQAGNYYLAEHEPLKAAKHLQQAQSWEDAVTVLLRAADDLVNELQIEELCTALLVFKPHSISAAQWREVQILLSDLFSKSGRHEEAVAACRRALTVSDETFVQARIYRRLGKLYENYNQLHALGYYQQALERFSAADPEVLDLLKDRAWLYIFRQDWDKASADLQRALAQTPTTALEQRANIDDAFASLYRRQKTYSNAIQAAQNALALREKTGDLLLIAASCNNLGLIYNDMGEYQQAIAAYEEAMKTYQKLGNRNLIAAAFLNIGMAHHLGNHLSEAMAAYRESLAICQAIGLPLVEIKAHSNLAEVLAELGEAEAARHHWQTGYEQSRQAGFEDQVTYFNQLQQKFSVLQYGAGAEKGLPEATLPPAASSLTIADHTVLEIVKAAGRVTSKLLMETLHVSKATATRRLAELVEWGHLEKCGEGRGTYYARPAANQRHPPASPAIRRHSGIALEAVPDLLRPCEQSLRQQYRIDGLGITTTASGEILTLTVRFAVLPGLLGFFELEKELGNHLGVRVDLQLAERLEVDALAATIEPSNREQVTWIWS